MLKFTNQVDTFIGFFDLKACQAFSLDETYFIEIVRAEVVGNMIHLLIEVSAESGSQGLICEAYEMTSQEFQKLVAIFFEAETEHVVAVSTVALTCVNGSAKLTKRDDHIVVDWSSFDAEELPCGELFDYYDQ